MWNTHLLNENSTQKIYFPKLKWDLVYGADLHRIVILRVCDFFNVDDALKTLCILYLNVVR